MDIQQMSKEEFIQYAKNFNVFRNYTFDEFTNSKNAILNRLTELNLTLKDIQPDKVYPPADVRVFKQIGK